MSPLVPGMPGSPLIPIPDEDPVNVSRLPSGPMSDIECATISVVFKIFAPFPKKEKYIELNI